MPLYLLRANYTVEGTKGLMKEGGVKRRAAVQSLVKKAGGKLLSFHYAIGSDDVYIIAEVPDAATAIGLSVTVNASGAVNLHTTPLVTAEEFDEALGKTIVYRAPGQ